MDTKIILTAIIALIIGFGGAYLVQGASSPRTGSHMMSDGRMMHDGDMGMESAMDDMMAGLEGKTGDAFDRAFIEEMIMHHEGAVDMAEAALEHAKHAEIKDMARAIISAQTAEIGQMKQWGRDWYGE